MKRYVIVGTSHRALSMYARPIVERFQDTAQLVGVYDVNGARPAAASPSSIVSTR
jgi:predicted dehydrogenase